MDAPASQFSLEFSLLTRNKTAQKARAWWRDTAKKVRNKITAIVYSEHHRRASWPVQPFAVCVAVNKLDMLSGNAVNISTSTADLTSTQCTRCKKCEFGTLMYQVLYQISKEFTCPEGALSKLKPSGTL